MLKISKAKLALLVIAVFLIGGAAGLSFYGMFPGVVVPGVQGGAGLSAGIAANVDATGDPFARVKQLEQYLKENYYKPITDGAIETGLLRGLFTSPGDPYTIYYTKEDFDQTMEKTHGELSGVGLTLMPNDDDVIEVLSVVPGSPADKAGIRKGDLLLTVGGTVYSGAQLTEAVEAARGEPGTKVDIGISRDGKAKDYTITRSVFVTPTVAREIMKNANGARIGVISVSSFNDNTAEDFETALNYMNSNNVRGIVIDVRNNAGGLVEQAVEMADMLLDKGVICYAEDGKGEQSPYETKDGKVTDLPYAVIIDGTSVSAAEIFALGVKANDGGRLVGQTTYGKGLIQKLERFDAGDGARITIMQYVTPSGDPVNGVGIAPDDAVVQPEDAEIGTPSDAQLQKALDLL